MIYRRKSRLPVRTQQKLLEHFVAGTTARATALLVGVQANTAKRFYQRLRQLIASKQESYLLAGEIEADESYFGGVRKGRRGRGAAGKVPVFGVLKRGGKVYTAIIPDAKASTLIPIIREKVLPDSVVYTDSFPVYDVLDVSEFHHRRVNHSKVFVSKRGHHINGIENFWNQAKRHLRRFNGIPKGSFYWFLKECEWRFNGGGHNALLQQLKVWYRFEINRP
jgi:transposase